jgi:16S rRNA (adenine1518-N6/adenine1519-N6)-dimethyltransferase
VEKDPDLVKYLQEHLKEAIAKKQLTLLEDDARNADTIIKYIKGDYTIVANIPYYITGALFKAYLSLPKKPKRMVVLIQKEVAERIVARDKKESILSLSIKAYGVPRIVKKVDKGSFYPTPKVDSAILCVDNVSGDAFANKKEEEVFFKVLHTGFAHKRKQLISNLREMENKETLTALFANLSLKETTRAEDLTLSDWLILAKKLSR